MHKTIALLCAIALPHAAAADTIVHPASAAEAVESVGILDGWRAPDGSRVAALEIRLAPGWHTYWRIPGEAGMPPQFDWSGSTNLGAVSYEWPRPSVFDSFGLRSYGFENSLVLPMVLRPSDPGRPLDLSLEVQFGVCNDICVPALARIASEIAPDEPATDRPTIEAALRSRPVSAPSAEIASATCGLAPGKSGYEVTAEVTLANNTPVPEAAVLETSQPDLWIGSPEVRTQGQVVTARAPVEIAGAGGALLERRAITITLLGPDHAIEVRGCHGAAEAALR